MKGKRINVLDQGFVELVDFMGSDQMIVDAARVSVSGDEVKPTSTNRQLIRYLMRHKHTTPFESVTVTFAVQAPILVVRQWMRHRTQSYSEMSARYGVIPDAFYIPELDRMNNQAKKNHQGSDDSVVDGATTLRSKLVKFSEVAYQTYQDLLDSGLARELARNVLPVSIYTKMYCTMNLHNLFAFLRLRLDPHAQYEIRVYAQAMFELMQEICPIACEAYEDYSVDALYLNRMEISAIKELFQLSDTSLLSFEDNKDFLKSHVGSDREAEELYSKILRLID